MGLYKKKPAVVEAVRLGSTPKGVCEALVFMGYGVVTPCRKVEEAFDDYVSLVNKEGLKIDTAEGVVIASVGDYIIKDVNGNLHTCKPDVFEKTYELLGGIEEHIKRFDKTGMKEDEAELMWALCEAMTRLFEIEGDIYTGRKAILDHIQAAQKEVGFLVLRREHPTLWTDL